MMPIMLLSPGKREKKDALRAHARQQDAAPAGTRKPRGGETKEAQPLHPRAPRHWPQASARQRGRDAAGQGCRQDG